MNKTSRAFSLTLTYLFVLAALLAWQGPLLAVVSLQVSPLTWPTAGLDSNNVDAGPNSFPIGMRACAVGSAGETGTMANVKSSWLWTGPTNDPTPPPAEGTYIYLRPGTLKSYTFNGINLLINDPDVRKRCYDFYYEVEIKRDPAAYTKYRSYQISATADGGYSATGPVRQVGVEYLISQSRNSVSSIEYKAASSGTWTNPGVGGTMDFIVGSEYDIRLNASTATNGYEQLEAFINFPNTIFQVLRADSSYSADTSPFVDNPNDKLYANGCNWDEDPTSPTYASCLGVGKAGGTVTVVYRVRILSVPSAPLVNPEPLQTLIYDFSGSSFHYNADYSQTWYARVLPSAVFSKKFSPNPIVPGATSTLTFTITNLTTSPLTAVSFDDVFPATTSTPPAPGNMVVAATPNVTTNGCGGSPSSTATAGTGLVSFSAMSIAGSGTCTITVDVTAPAVGAYPNTSDYLHMNGGVTNLRASDTLIVLANTTDTCRGTSASPITLASWAMGTTSRDTDPSAPAVLGGPPATLGPDVASAVATFRALNGGTTTINTAAATGNPANSWQGLGLWYTGTVGTAELLATVTDGGTTATTPHFSSFQFAVNTSAYSSGTVTISLDYLLFSTQGQSGWSNGADNRIVVYSSTNGTTWSRIYDLANRTRDTWYSTGTLAAAATGTTTTYFRVTFAGVNQQADAAAVLDNIVIRAFCSNQPPRISKVFSTDPVALGATSALTFTITNPTYNNALTGITFTDILPAGLTVATAGPTAACGGTWTTTAPSTISFSGGSLAATAATVTTCTVPASGGFTVTAATPSPTGQYNNESSPFVSAAVTGPNTDPTCGEGIACDTLNTVVPPTISKEFDPAIIQSGSNSTLTFTISNPTSSSMANIGFTDDYPPYVIPVADPPVPTGTAAITNVALVSNGCGGSLTLVPGSRTVSISGVTLAANASCTLSVTVTSSTLGTHVNTSNRVYRELVPGGTRYYGNAATASLIVRNLAIGLLKEIALSTAGPWFKSLAVPNPTNVFFRLTVENQGEAAFTSGSITDDKIVPATFVCTPDFRAVGLGIGEVATCISPAFSVTAAGTNTATVTGNVGASSATSPPSTASYTTTALSLTKAYSSTALVSGSLPPGKEYLQAGDVVTYSYTVTNTGAATLYNLFVDDNRVDTLSCNKTTLLGSQVPADFATCTATYKITADDVLIGDSHITNVARARTTLDAAPPSPIVYIYSNLAEVTIDGPGYNYGGLPVPNFDPLTVNVFPSGGARNLSCSVFLGASREDLPDYGPSADPTPAGNLRLNTNWNGVTTPLFEWSAAAGGRLAVTVTGCTGTCYLNGWINWQQNGDFSSQGNKVFDNRSVSNGTLNYDFAMPASAVTTAGTKWYARFRLTAASVPGASPTGGGGCGEVEDYALDVTTLTTTPVTLAYFHAYDQGGRTRFEWTTASEAGNFGFDVYSVSKDAKGRERLTKEPLTSAATDPTQPQDYEFETALGGEATEFYLEDIDIQGARRLHGPFGLGKPYGKKPTPVKTDWASIRREHDRRQKDQLDAAFVALASEKVKASPRANLVVAADGLYRVTYEGLLAAGFDFGEIHPKDLAVFNRGVAVPIEVTGAGNKFGPGSAIQFWGTGLKTIYTYNNVYTLEVDKTNALRVKSDPTVPSISTPVPISYLETVKVENARSYDFVSTANDPWFDTRMLAFTSRVTKSFPITLDWVASSSDASVTANYYGVTDWPLSPDHHVLVRFNDAPLASDLFDGRTNRTVRASLPDGVLREGANTMSIILPGDTGADWDVVNLKSYSVTYPRQFVAREGRLAFEATGTVFRVDRLPSPNAIVYRVSGNEIVRLEGAQIESRGIGYSVRFPGSGQPAKYVVTTIESALAPSLSVPRSPSGLTAGPAEFLIVSHPDFIGHLGPLVAARQAEGLSVKVVDVKDVFAQYGHGIFDPGAIKSYIAEAAADMGTKYVLLVGGDTYDYRNDLGKGAISFIPTLYAQTDGIVTFAPVDPLFGDLDGDDVPDVAIGRFPVRTTAELDSMIRKTLAYGNRTENNTAVFSSDAAEPGVSYKAISQSFINSLPAGWKTEQANIDDAGLEPARTKLLGAMNSGVAFANFIGHSSFSVWTFDPIFDDADAKALTNHGKPLFVSQFGCWNTYFVSPYYDTLGHAFLLSGDQGAAGVMGASTLTEVGSDRLFGQFLFPRMTVPGKRIGTAINEAKREAAALSNDATDVLLGWVLLGDPTLVIQR